MFHKKGGENVKDVITIGLLLLSSINDIRSYKVKNSYIIFGYCVNILFFIANEGYKSMEQSVGWIAGLMAPILLLWIFFRYKAIGAGDIKLFSIIGGLYGLQFVIIHMILALFCGATISIIHFIKYKDFWYRLSYFISFFSEKLSLKRIIIHPVPYYDKDMEGNEPVIPYTLAITVGFLLQRFGKLNFGILFSMV